MNWGTTEELIPLSWFKHMRAHSPVVYHEEQGYWDVFNYEDIKSVFADHEHYSSVTTDNVTDPIDASILKLDPPKHRQLRKLVSQAFTPRVIESLAPKIESIAHELCDLAEAGGRMDALHDFASPLPIIIIAEMLGIPAEDRERFKLWSEALVGDDYDAYLQCQGEMNAYFSQIADRRRREPVDDLISNLVHAKVDGEQLSELELIGFCILLLVAGNETTTNLITSAILCLDTSKESKEQLIENPGLVPQAIEEVLRYCSPVQMMIRRVKQTTVLRGRTLQQGQMVQVRIGSANHDEEQFDHPERFDIHRSPNPHLAFGYGIHFCLGAQLARLESRIAIQTLLARFPHYERDRSHPLERMKSSIIFGVNRLPLILRSSN
ncbi:cytochrome P450 [Paenibacillus spongiae]|uniref:Cytochrome P450 n=1 Tax=Paenibacillus spongiae TaxID=2909671 RepID=A0ABY5SJ89_9BACL|nr:cytochrome P450 [Paenibacillus spongiae]UVI32772.1 cytochrome P450 [Paenibacillus spongiae]